uniref:MAB_1171c family putative transporter n=1 Tax=Nocardia suismassiliense TaxID=2077092 RepID=UPI003F499FD3
MTSPVPPAIAWPILLLIAAITAGRWWLLRDGHVDRLINRALTAALCGLLLRENAVQQLLARLLPFDDTDTINLARQLSFGCILLTVAGIYGIAKLWAGADPAQTWRRQRGYDAFAMAATVVVLIAGTPARRADQLIDQALGWPAVVAWTAFYLPIGATAVLVARISIQEIRDADDTTSWRERTVYLGVLGIAVAIFLDALATPLMTAHEVLTQTPSRDPQMHAKALTFFLAAIWAGTVVAVPLISTLLTVTGWDRTGRYCRRLQPLWRDLTAAVPEIVLEMPRDQHGRIEPATRLHRMTVEIRDSLLHLRRYCDTTDEIDTATTDPDTYAQHIAAAITAKAAGHTPVTRITARPPVQLGARDLTGELQQLLDLARAWPPSHPPALVDH